MNKKKSKRQIKITAVQPDSPKYIAPYEKECTYKNLKPIAQANVDHILELADRAGSENPDLIITPEDITGTNYCSFRIDDGELYFKFAQTVPGPITEQAGKIAKKHSCYLIINLVEESKGKFYNASVLIDRKGRVAGKYHKVHLALEENYYLTAGTDFPVFETDFGKLGLMICFDNYFPESARSLALNGAELITMSTYGLCAPGETDQLLRVKARACDNVVYFAMSIYGSNKEKQEGSHPGRSCIVDLNGNVLSDAGYWADSFATATIDLDRKRYDNWNAEHSGIEDFKAFVLKARRPKIYKTICQTNPEIMKKYEKIKFRPKSDYKNYVLQQIANQKNN
jgi:predicted amidohydrolase